MNKNIYLLPINLRLFDEGAAVGGGGTAATTGEGAAAESKALPGSDQQVPATKVVYGKQEFNEDGTPTATKPEVAAKAKAERSADFEKLITGDYKDLFAERTQQIINKRFAATKSLEATVNAVNPILEVLSQKYNGEKDPTKLLDAIMSDDAMWESLADNMGLTVEQYKTFAKVNAENQMLKSKEQNQEQQAFANNQYSTWQGQAEELRTLVPGFDLDAEAEASPEFVNLLKAGVDVKAAYQVIHLDEVKQATARAVENNLVANIRAKGNRPNENGASSAQVGVTYKADVNNLTVADLKEIEKRVQRGEKIVF